MVTCSKCKQKSRVTIPVPALQKESTQRKTSAGDVDFGEFFRDYGKGFSDIFKTPKK